MLLADPRGLEFLCDLHRLDVSAVVLMAVHRGRQHGPFGTNSGDPGQIAALRPEPGRERAAAVDGAAGSPERQAARWRTDAEPLRQKRASGDRIARPAGKTSPGALARR